MRRFRVAAVGLLLTAIAMLTVVLPPASAQTEDRTSGESDLRAAADTGAAPAWPFVGIVALRLDRLRDPVRESSALVYWNSETGALSEVVLDQGPWGVYCPGEFSANRHWVRYVWYAHSGNHLEFVVPWGDDAYPILHSERFVDFHTSAEGSRGDDSAAERLDVAMRYGVLRVDNSEEIAYYWLPYDSYTEGHGLARVDSHRSTQRKVSRRSRLSLMMKNSSGGRAAGNSALRGSITASRCSTRSPLARRRIGTSSTAALESWWGASIRTAVHRRFSSGRPR